MTTVGLSFKGMKDTVFLPPNESSGLVKALLELDDSPAGSDEEFLDFQFKIADAKAREREASEQLSDWRAAFANLQLRQAQEIAEFALNQRKEDEQRVAQQTVELSELRSSLQACELELERVKAENASLLQHKSELEKDFDQELRYSESLRQSINEHNHVQERLVLENLELKRALDEATVTTGRLKEALVEKASELSAWLGLDGINVQAMPPSILDEKFSLKAEEKKAYSAHGEDSQGFETSEKTGAMRSQDANERTDSSRVIDEATTPVQCGAASTSTSLDDDCADMKHEVSSDRLPSSRESTVRNANDSSHRCKGVSVRDLIAEERESFGHDSSPGKKERILTLEQKIQELQLELDGLKSQHHHPKDDIELWVFKQRSCPLPLTEAAKDDTEFEARLSSDSSSTTEKAEITVSAQPGSSFSNEAGLEKSSEEHKLALTLKDHLRKVELELEHSKQGWAAEQDFIDSCLGDESGGLFGEERSFSRNDVDNLEKKVEELTNRLEENERELGELMVISGIDFDAVVSAKLKRMEQRLEDSKASEALVRAEKTELASQVSWLKSKLAEVEHELHLENQQHVEILIRYEEEQGQLEASSRSERAALNAKVIQLEKLLAEKTKQFETGHPGSPKSQVHGLRANVLALESSLAAERQKGIDSEACMKAHLSKEKDKNIDLEAKLSTLQSTVTSLKSELSEAEQREKRAQSQIEKLMIELGIAKEEVLKCEVRMQKIIRQAKEDVDAEKRRLEESHNNQKQMEWHLCRQIELTEGLEREKAKIREVLEEFEIQNLALEKERDDLRTAYMQLARQTAQRVG
ncbi:hypothetical protein Mapa_012680 [Marchantia paleacea]|nr:hypothetical protein Mapa_012680 [Marchantia paleacea]